MRKKSIIRKNENYFVLFFLLTNLMTGISSNRTTIVVLPMKLGVVPDVFIVAFRLINVIDETS